MVQPRPVSLTQVNEADYEGAFEPEPLLIVGPVPGGGGGGGGVASVNGKTGIVVLTASDVGAAPTNHTQSIASITGLQVELDSKATPSEIPSTPGDIGAATAAQGSLADTAVQPASLATYVPNTRTVAGKPLSSNVALDKIDVGLSNVDNTSDVNKPVSTTQQDALDGKVPNTRTVAGKALSANVTLVRGDVGLGNVDNTSDANKPVSTATTTQLNLKAPLASPAFTGTPTGITKAHVGLGNVDNTSDAAKPVSTAQAAAINVKVGSGNSTVTGLEYYPTVGDLPGTGVTGVIYFVDAV